MRPNLSARSVSHLTSASEPGTVAPAPLCLNCGASLAGAYCAACGQPKVDLDAPTLHVLRDALSDVTDFDGRVLRTVRAMGTPGRLTLEFLRGRRAPYLSPLKLFLIVGTVLSVTWALTRGVDARYYGYANVGSASAYIDTLVRGLLAASVTIAVSSWIFSLGRRRFLDEAVFALHVVSAVSLWIALVIWLATAWKLVWVTAARVPRGVLSLPFLMFLPALVVALGYIAAAVRRVHGVRWWVALLHTLVFAVVGAAVVRVALLVL
jgi:hypothetical protein